MVRKRVAFFGGEGIVTENRRLSEKKKLFRGKGKQRGCVDVEGKKAAPQKSSFEKNFL